MGGDLWRPSQPAPLESRSLEDDLNAMLDDVNEALASERGAGSGGAPVRQSGSGGGGGSGSGGGGFLSDWPPSRRLLAAMIGANVAVYIAWQSPAPAVISVLERWFLTSARSLHMGARGAVTWLGATYSHVGFLHMGFNMFALWSFGPHLMERRSTRTAVRWKG